MNIFKHTLVSAILLAPMAMPCAYARQAPDSKAPEIVLSENPPTFLESLGYVALFVATAYIMKNIIPPLPPEAKGQETTTSSDFTKTIESLDTFETEQP